MTVGNKLGFPLKGNGTKMKKNVMIIRLPIPERARSIINQWHFLISKREWKVLQAIDSKDGAKEPDLVP